jgi:DNA-binding Lrp family transcriptional regulator
MPGEAIVLINTEIGAEKEVFEKMKNIERVGEAFTVVGVYDIVARVKAETVDKRKEIVTWRIRKADKVRSTLTMPIIEGTRRITGEWTKESKAIVIINTEIGSENEVMGSFERLNEEPERVRLGKIVEASIVYGVYDIVAFVEAPTKEELMRFVSWRIRKADKVRSTLTLFVVESEIRC